MIIWLNYFKAVLSYYSPQTYSTTLISLGGGYDSTITASSKRVSNASDRIYFADGWFFGGAHSGVPRPKITNITITRSVNSVRFQGVLSSSNGVNYTGGSLIISNTMSKFRNGHTYTLGRTFKDNIGTLDHAGAFAISGNYYYQQQTPKKKGLDIFTANIDTQTNNGFGFLIILKAGTNIPFDFTISDVFMYEGAYRNPPLYISPDVNPNMSIMYKDRLYERRYGSFPAMNTSTTVGWQRLYNIPTYGWTEGYSRHTFFKGILQISKEYNNSVWSYIEVEFGVASIYYAANNISTFKLLEPVAYGVGADTSTSLPFNKFRITRDANYHFYLDGYHHVNVNNGIHMNLKDWVLYALDYDWYLYKTMVDPTDNTYIKNYLEVMANEFHYRETIPDDIVTVVEKTVTLKMNS